MPFTVTMPKLSPTMEEGTIAKWHKKEGDFVEAGEVLLEIATDKATVEHTALDEGWLRKQLVADGASARVNQPIAIFTEEEKETIEDFEMETPPPEPEAEEAPLEEVVAKPAPVVAAIVAHTPEPPLATAPPKRDLGDKIKASPLAKSLAKKRGLDLSTVAGTGPGGRITADDLEKAQPASLVTFGRQESPHLPGGTYEEIPLSPVRKIIAKRLQESKSFIPHFYVKQKVDAEHLVHLRQQLKEVELHVTFNDLIIKATSLALRKHPEVNTGFNSSSDQIIQFKTVDISFAVQSEAGLITPIIRHADYKNVGEISLEVKELAGRAHKSKLKEHEYKGGSFCISNLGMFGISEFVAVINPPQAAILAVGGIEEMARVREGKFSPGLEMTLTLSADHRVIDGALAAEFMKSLQHLLENPAGLIL